MLSPLVMKLIEAFVKTEIGLRKRGQVQKPVILRTSRPNSTSSPRDNASFVSEVKPRHDEE
jgi:hypothetical protein